MNGECSETGNHRYATARAAHIALQQVYWAKRSKEQPRRVYFCKRCQGYHLTSRGDLWGRRYRLAVDKKRQEAVD